MADYYITYYEYGDKEYNNIACYTKANEDTTDEIKTAFFETVAGAIVGMEKRKGYDVTRVVFDGELLKWRVSDIDCCNSVLVTFSNYHTGKVVHRVSAPW